MHKHDIIKKAYKLLFPDEEFMYRGIIRYSAKFADYNANVRMYGSTLEYRLSRKWGNISEEIVIGLIQELLLKILGRKGKSTYIDLYNSFVKNLHIAVPKTRSHPVLEESFNRVNDKYFFGVMEMPNLIWGKRSTSQMGLYDFKRDTITVSRLLTEADPDLIDYIMYHELLHKKTKFKSTNGRTFYHSKEFKAAERAFEGFEFIEKKLQRHIRREKVRGFFRR